jgi:hypothetical protein
MPRRPVTEWRAVAARWHLRARAIGAIVAFGGFVAALANRDRVPALLLGVLGIYLAVAADRARRS